MHCRSQYQRIGKGHVVADHQRRPGLRNVFQSDFAQSENGVDQNPIDKATKVFGHQCIDIHRDGGVEQCTGQKDLRNAQTHRQQSRGQSCRCYHEQRIQNIVGRHDARSVRAF